MAAAGFGAKAAGAVSVLFNEKDASKARSIDFEGKSSHSCPRTESEESRLVEVAIAKSLANFKDGKEILPEHLVNAFRDESEKQLSTCVDTTTPEGVNLVHEQALNNARKLLQENVESAAMRAACELAARMVEEKKDNDRVVKAYMARNWAAGSFEFSSEEE